MIYMRGEPIYVILPSDLVERMLDYVTHVLAALALLVKSPGKTASPAMALAPTFG